MKKHLFLAAQALLCFFISCRQPQDKTIVMSQAGKNLVSLHLLYKGIETGDNSMLDTMIAKNYVDHVPGHDVTGLQDLKKYLAQLHDGINGLKINVLAEASSDTCVFAKIELTGTTKAPMNGMPPNMNMDMTIVDVLKMKNGKFAERWAFVNPNDMMKQMAPPKAK